MRDIEPDRKVSKLKRGKKYPEEFDDCWRLLRRIQYTNNANNAQIVFHIQLGYTILKGKNSHAAKSIEHLINN